MGSSPIYELTVMDNYNNYQPDYNQGYDNQGYDPYGGYPQQPQQPAPHISNYLAWAIVCIFLCWPLAIPAIVYASKVNNLIAMGDYEGAMNASKNAKTFCIIATVLGAIAIVLGIIGGIIGGMAASSYYYYYYSGSFSPVLQQQC